MRKAGILMPITSLPSPWGIGTLGDAARSFLYFLEKAGQSYWQVLPIGQTGYGDSPYQPFSSYAGNPYLIDLDDLCRDGLLTAEEYQNLEWGSDPQRVDYGKMYEHRFAVLKKAGKRLFETRRADLEAFCSKEDYWLDDYSLFMAIKEYNSGASWQFWSDDLRKREPDAIDAARSSLADDILFWKEIQFLFFEQWDRLKKLAESKNISIIGDIPIYVSEDSADVWSHPEQFQMDEDLRPIRVAGCPPDGFSATGQLWGNPLFDWKKMEADGYQWWMRRISFQFRFYDVLRIDHFRGFESYYGIPRGSADACNGSWEKGPGIRFFLALEKTLGKRRIIAEDLGFITEDVRRLLDDSGFPGMKLLEFGFDSRDGGGRMYQPHNYPKNCVAYVGTHDNDTAMGWLETAVKEDVAFAREYLHLDKDEGENWGMMRAIWNSAANTAIVQMQDLLGLGSSARMNTPSTLGGNWQWRALPEDFSEELASKVRRQMHLYERLSK